MSELSIVLFRYKPNPEKPGIHSFDRPATINELENEFTRVLESTQLGGEGKNAKQLSEWVYKQDKRAVDEPVTNVGVTQARLTVMFRHGGSEGYIIDLVLLDVSKNTYKTLISAKWLTNEPELWGVMKALSDAIYQGDFD